MRRHVVFLLIFLLSSTILASAQSEKEAISLGEPPPNLVNGLAEPPFDIQTVDIDEVPGQIANSNDSNACGIVGVDECEAADDLEFSLSSTNSSCGSSTLVNLFTTDVADPVLTCMVNNPPSLQGYRTTWYRFVPLESGVVTVSTEGDPTNYVDSYDTAVAIYLAGDPDNGCSTLTQVACNDDFAGFFSQVSVSVIQDAVYYIEVVDRNASVNGDARLDLNVTFDASNSLWTEQAPAQTSWNKPRSRHFVVEHSGQLYVVAGQTANVGTTGIRDGVTEVFNPNTSQWTNLFPMDTLSDNLGYSNTTGALYQGRIYFPAGWVGGLGYEGVHRVYDIASGGWLINNESVPWPGGAPYGWSAAATTPSGYQLTGGAQIDGSGDPIGMPTNYNFSFSPSAGGTEGDWDRDADMTRSRYGHVAAYVGNRTCVAGGIDWDLSGGTDPAILVIGDTECYSAALDSWDSGIPQMNFPRYMAGSAVGPDGRWYVFGGLSADIDGNPVAVTVTEVFDPVTETWTALDSRFDLKEPGRAWPRGDFVGNALWVIGGEESNARIVPLIEKLTLPSLYSPIIAHQIGLSHGEPNDTFVDATPIGIDQMLDSTFATVGDSYDFYAVYVPTRRVINATLTGIPNTANYDVYLYGPDKFPVGSSTNFGSLNEEASTFVVTPGTYYVMVLNVNGTALPDTYTLWVWD